MKRQKVHRGSFYYVQTLLGKAALFLVLVTLNGMTVFAANPSNAPKKGSVVAGYLNDPDLQTNIQEYAYQAPEGKIAATYNSVEDMRINGAGHAPGEYIQTLNYYEETEGGGAVYQVESFDSTTDNGGTIIDLPGNICCRLVSGNNTVSPLQFGAYGDGITDDYEPLKAAINSGFGIIILEGRTYLSNDTLWITKSNILIEGMGATITCNNDFGSYQKVGKEDNTQFYVTKCSDVTFRHIRFMDGQTTNHSRGLLYLQSVSNIDITWCTLLLPEGLSSDKEDGCCNLSFQNGWHNVSTTHCEIINLSGLKTGGAVGYNDMYASGSDNALFENNVVIYNVKDEVIAIFSHSREGSEYFNRQSYIRNVFIHHNEFYGPKSSSWRRDLDFSVGYNDSLEIDNVVYEENYFETDAVWSFMSFSKTATNCAARGNVIHVVQTSDKTSMTVFYTEGEFPGEVEDNIIEISTENENIPSSIASGRLLLRNNQVDVKGDIQSLFMNGAVSEKNQIQVNGTVKKAISYRGGDMADTNITITGNCGSIFESYDMVMSKDIVWKGNDINLPNATETGSLFTLNGMKMNHYTFTMKDNVIATPEATKNAMIVYDNIKDDDPSEQKIILDGNEFGAFDSTGNKVSIYRINNVFTLFDNTIIKDYEVIFDLDGKAEAESQSVIGGEKAKEPEVKNLKGYKLLGWYSDKTYQTLWDFDTDIICQNTTLYAKLEKLPEETEETDLPKLPDGEIQNSADANGNAQVQAQKKPAKVSGLKLKCLKADSQNVRKRKVKITWKAVKGVTGYQIYISTNKGKKYKKVKTISAKKKCTYTYTSIKGKTVYVKIRAYKKNSKGTSYGSFCKAKKIKLK